MAVDDRGTLYVSYIGYDKETSSLELARSEDAGRTFAVQTVTDKHVSDKPELAVSPDGKDISIVYESSPGPRLISSHDAGATWDEGKVVVPSVGRHFWPTGLAMGPGGDIWFAVPSMSDADIQKKLPTTVTLHAFRSSDRGKTWSDSEFGGSPRILGGCVHDPECGVKVPSIGVAADRGGKAYVAYTEGKARQPYTLFLKSSVDGGESWTAARRLSLARRQKSADEADCDFVHVAAQGNGRACVVWMDDRLGAKNIWARCTADGGRSWGDETLLSNRRAGGDDGAASRGIEGFGQFFGHYGGAAISSSGRLHAAWPEGPYGKEEGAVWVNDLDLPTVNQR
ncbi:MAG: sialidase family protein [Acidobacteriota bacterium]